MMNVLAMQKDSELFLANYARAFIQKFNLENSTKGIVAFPKFPLWAFLPDSFYFDGDIKTALINEATFTKKDDSGLYEFYFPLCITSENGLEVELKIVFATACANENKNFAMVKKLDEEKKMPLGIKSFRMGVGLFNDNAWQLFDEKWLRCKSQKVE